MALFTYPICFDDMQSTIGYQFKFADTLSGKVVYIFKAFGEVGGEEGEGEREGDDDVAMGEDRLYKSVGIARLLLNPEQLASGLSQGGDHFIML